MLFKVKTLFLTCRKKAALYLVIADLTDKNPNVFYELALRHAIRKPLVQMIMKGEVIPFDVAATRIIQFDLHNLDSVAAAKEEITSQVKSLESGKSEVHNPISVSIDLKVLKSGNIEERSLADIVESISDLRLAVTSVDKGLSSSKLIEEMKTQIESLPSKIEDRLDPDFRRKRRWFHPMMIEEMLHFEMREENPNHVFLMMISLFKDDFPWIYEIGLETYRELKSSKTKEDKMKLLESFERTLEMTKHPMMREFYGKSEDLYILSKEIPHFFHRYYSRYLDKTQ